MIFQGLRPAGAIKIIPVVKSGPGNAELLQRAFNRQMRVLDQPDDLKLLGRGISFAFSPIREHAFFEQPQFQRLLGDHLLQLLGFTP